LTSCCGTMTSHAQAWFLPGFLGVLAILGLLVLYIELRDAVRKGKPVPVRIDQKRKLKLLNGRHLTGRSHRKAADSRRGKIA
jgi:hypothetical protein